MTSKIEEAKEKGINFYNNRFSFSFKRMDELNIEYGNQNQLEEGCLNEAFNRALNHLKESYEKEIKWLNSLYVQIDNLDFEVWAISLKKLWFEFEEHKYLCDNVGKNIFKRWLLNKTFESIIQIQQIQGGK